MGLDFLLKWVTGRNLAIVFGLVLLAFAGDLFQEYPRALYERLAPRQATKGDAALSRDIAAELDMKDSLRLRSLHREVTGEIARAGQQGRPVAGLQQLADAALALDMPGYRRAGLEKLNEVRLRIPRGDSVRPVSPEDDRDDIPPDIKGTGRPRRR